MTDGLAERIRQLEEELDALPEPKRTWFLAPDLEATSHLSEQVDRAASSPIVDAVMRSWAGAVAVLNDRRQVVALNSRYLNLLGVPNVGAVLGLRPGEALGCVHARDHLPGGCGTSAACRTCGTAIALLGALEEGSPSEHDCSLAVTRDGEILQTEFKVRASPLTVEGERFILLAMTDVSRERRRAALERAFFHDLANLLMGVVGACDAMDGADPAEIAVAAEDAREVASRIVQELKLQRALTAASPSGYVPATATVPLSGVLETLRALFLHHPLAAGKRLRVAGAADHETIETDPYLLQRLLMNMIVNAFEASPDGAEIRLTVELGAGEVAFRVWNAGVIPAAVAPRIFQRYFSTKGSEGRGQGTFVMKHFGEKVLRGRVGFTSTQADGTTFVLAIPRSSRPRALSLVAG